MKKAVFMILISLLAVGILMTGCQRSAGPTAGAASTATTGPFPGKIALVTSDVAQNEEEFRSAEMIVAKYGSDKVTHVTWPTNFMAEQEQMVTIVARVAADRDVKALVINQSVPGTNPAVDRLLQTRNDVFIVYCNPQENPPDVARRANLVINTDDFARGPAIAIQAHTQGAKVFIHYSFPRHMSNVLIAARRDFIRDECQRLGIQYVDATAPDPTGDGGITGTQQFILEDVPRMIARYGSDTAFFGANCAMQIPLITRIIEGRAIYPEPCCPSPTHAFPQALGIDATGRGTDMPWMVTEITRAVGARGMHGRLSTWPAPAAMTWTAGGTNYAIKYLNGEVPRDRIDEAALKESMESYFRELLGTEVPIGIRSYQDASSGAIIDNYKLIIMGHLTF